MVTPSPSTSGPVCVIWSYTPSFRSPSPAAEPGWLENVETEGGRGRDGVHGIFNHDDPDFSAVVLTRG
jgi:hypothetical protein